MGDVADVFVPDLSGAEAGLHKPVELSPRMVEAAWLAGDGWTFAEIGARLGCSARTAKAHCDSARLRLGVAHKRHLGRALRAAGFERAEA